MADLNGIDVLLLEDEPLIAMDLELDLRAAGARVHHAQTCAGALKHLHERRMHIGILDLIVGSGDCSAAAQECRVQGIPYLITSEMAAKTDILGCADRIEKPFSNAELIAKIGRILGTAAT